MNYDNFTVVYMVRVGGSYHVWTLTSVFDLLVKKKVDVGLSLGPLCMISWHLSLLKAQSEFQMWQQTASTCTFYQTKLLDAH